MRIQYEGLALPVTQKLADELAKLIDLYDVKGDEVTFNFRDPTYSAERGGFHPVEIRLEKRQDIWHLCYITDFCFVGKGYEAELAKELDFDFQAGIFQDLLGVYPIERVRDLYQVWEDNFLHYWLAIKVFGISVS
ncbi:DUF2787 family protein [Bowmanella pacifica]|uniref:DUF2787 domain-containing protein n=1 Tax=Bowmanella pacifica TaxID=502051 RepID=A0A917YSN9_9ALTE|nr:DUF2787 family protein [Bowmanella pacifica]GGO65358.1 hypothetical protein GCM10010982_06980 [Bowmanella pacifica]